MDPATHAQHMSEGLQLASLMGYAGFFFLAATVLLGMATALDLWGDRISAAALEQVHLTCAILGLAGILGHIAGHCVRAVGGMAWWQAFVPFASGDWIVALGVVGWLGLLVVTVSVPFRQRLGYRTWLRIHRAAYVAFGLMAGHVVLASDEVTRLAVVGIAVLATLLIVMLGGRRRARGTADFRPGSSSSGVPGPGPAARVVELEP